MKWLKDLDSVGLIVMGAVASIMMGVLSATLGGSNTSWFVVGASIVVVGSLMKAAHDTY